MFCYSMESMTAGCRWDVCVCACVRVCVIAIRDVCLGVREVLPGSQGAGGGARTYLCEGSVILWRPSACKNRAPRARAGGDACAWWLGRRRRSGEAMRRCKKGLRRRWSGDVHAREHRCVNKPVPER